MKALPRITEKGLIRLEAHLSRPEIRAVDDPLNALMIVRLRKGNKTPQDVSFYLHELKESALMNRGMSAREAHLATLRWQSIDYVRGYEAHLYAPEAYRLLNPTS